MARTTLYSSSNGNRYIWTLTASISSVLGLRTSSIQPTGARPPELYSAHVLYTVYSGVEHFQVLHDGIDGVPYIPERRSPYHTHGTVAISEVSKDLLVLFMPCGSAPSLGHSSQLTHSSKGDYPLHSVAESVGTSLGT